MCLPLLASQLDDVETMVCAGHMGQAFRNHRLSLLVVTLATVYDDRLTGLNDFPEELNGCLVHGVCPSLGQL